MYKGKPKLNNVKRGAEKLRLKRDVERKAAGSDPKQTKLSFVKAPKKGKFI